MAALTTRSQYDRSAGSLQDFVKLLDPGYPVTCKQLCTLYEAVNRNDYPRAEEVTAVNESHALDRYFSGPAGPDTTLQERLKEISALLIANEKPRDSAQLVLYHAVMNHRLEECAEDLSRAGKSNLFIQQVALSLCGVTYSQIKDQAIKIWCEELDAALLTEMVKSVPDMPEDPATRAQYACALKATYASGCYSALNQSVYLKAPLFGLASKHRGTLKALLVNSPLSKVWTQPRIDAFNQRLAHNDDSSTPVEKPHSYQRQNHHIKKIEPLAPVAHAVLKTLGSEKESRDALLVTVATLKALLAPSP